MHVQKSPWEFPGLLHFESALKAIQQWPSAARFNRPAS